MFTSGRGNSGAKTSIDILRERDELRARVAELEAAMKTVLEETELAARYPEVNFVTLCRVSCVARRAVGGVASARSVAKCAAA